MKEIFIKKIKPNSKSTQIYESLTVLKKRIENII